MADTYQTIESSISPSLVQHPLEPLTAEEITAAVHIVRTERKLHERVRFASVALHEPAKEVRLNFKQGDPITREAFIILLDNTDGATYEAVVSITEGKVISWRHIPGVQPSLMLDEFFECEQAVKASPEFQEALRKRGITNFDLLMGGEECVQDFQPFYQENLSLIYRFVYSKVGNREEAEDLTSQIFIKAVRGVDTERGTQSMQKWLFQVARTTIADYWRLHYRLSVSSLEELLEAGCEGPAEEEPAALSSRSIDRVQRILRALPEHYREVLRYRFLLNLSIKETALKMGLTEANVKVLQFRALKRAADLEYVVTGTS